MAVAQKVISRWVSGMKMPILDLNHFRYSSTREIIAIGVLQIKEANKTKSSKACSGSVSRMAYLCRAVIRAPSFLIGMGVAIIDSLSLPCVVSFRFWRPTPTYPTSFCMLDANLLLPSLNLEESESYSTVQYV